MNIQHIKFKSKQYPQLLRDISAPPKELYCLGTIPDLPMVAIVGSRRPTDYGRKVTYRIAADLARAGICLVSGLAYGIDAIAHQAALEAGGKVVAVLGTPLDTIYPASNRNLAKEILKTGGAIISEYAVGTNTQRFNFPTRNRIIAGLSLAVLVTEADASSGSLITANFAITNNRLVMAVPGSVDSPRSAGPNNLLKTGAKPVTDAVDVLAELELVSPRLAPKTVRADSKEEAQIIELLNEGVNTTHDLIEQTEIGASQIASILSLMEITGKIRNMGAGQWIVR
jgi:DNA processing protein